MADDDKIKPGMKAGKNPQGINQTFVDENLELEDDVELDESDLAEIKDALLLNLVRGKKKLKKMFQDLEKLGKISLMTRKYDKFLHEDKDKFTGEKNHKQSVISKKGMAQTQTISASHMATKENSQAQTQGAFTELEMMLKKGASKTKTVLENITKVPAIFKHKLEKIAKNIDEIIGRSL